MKAIALGRGLSRALAQSDLGDEADRALVERHRAGDPAAFEELYRRHFGLVHHLGLRFLGNAEDADDMAQDVFFRVHRALGRFRFGSSLKTWIYRIAVNRCRSAWSRRRWRLAVAGSLLQPWSRGGERDGEEMVAEPADPARGPEDLALAGDEARRLTAALGRVPPAFRAAVLLRDLEGLSYDEIAAALGVPVGTVRSRIARGRDALRRELRREVG